MMSEFYYYVWGLYGLAALGLVYLVWLLVRRIRVSVIAHALLAFFAALLFTPARAIPEQADLTPAVVMALFDGIAQGWPGVWSGFRYILLVYLGLLAILLLLHLVKAWVRPKQQPDRNTETQAGDQEVGARE
jgi:hypothetical protein